MRSQELRDEAPAVSVLLRWYVLVRSHLRPYQRGSIPQPLVDEARTAAGRPPPAPERATQLHRRCVLQRTSLQGRIARPASSRESGAGFS